MDNISRNKFKFISLILKKKFILQFFPWDFFFPITILLKIISKSFGFLVNGNVPWPQLKFLLILLRKVKSQRNVNKMSEMLTSWQIFGGGGIHFQNSEFIKSQPSVIITTGSLVYAHTLANNMDTGYVASRSDHSYTSKYKI